MKKKRFTHLMSLVIGFGSHIGFTLKPIKKIFFRMAGQIKGKLHTSIPKATGVQVARSKYSSWGMSVVFLWCHNCICRTLHPISIKYFWGSSRNKIVLKIFLMMSSVTLFDSHIVFVFFKPSKTFFSEMAEKIEAKLYTYDRLSMKNKRVTHMMS